MICVPSVIQHLLFCCPIAFNFWEKLRELIRLKLDLGFETNAKTILFGIEFDKTLNIVLFY